MEASLRWLSRRLGLVTVTVCLTGTATVLVGFMTVEASSEHVIRSEALPQGVSAHSLRGNPLFVVRTGDEVTVFSGRSTHLGQRLMWCPQDRIFVEPMAGSFYDERGRVVPGSPAFRGMFTYESRWEDGDLLIDLATAEYGPSQHEDPGRPPLLYPDNFSDCVRS